MTKLTENLNLWILWGLVTTLGIAVGFILEHWAIARSQLGWANMLPVSIVALGFLVGIGQWAVLRMQLKKVWLWIPMTTMGAPLGFVLGMIVDSNGWGLFFWDTTNISSVVGLVLGVLQWFVIHKKVEKAIWWIPTSIVSWIIGTELAFHFFSQVQIDHFTWAENTILTGIVMGVVLGALVGINSGISVLFLIGKSSTLSAS